MPVVGSIAGASVIGGGLGFAGGKQQAKAANRASALQLQAAREAIAAQREGADKAADVLTEQSNLSRDFLRESFDKAREQVLNDPFRQAGQRALSQLEGLTQPGSALESQQRNAAQSQIQRQLASQGLLRSGRQASALTDLELGFAGQRQNLLQGLAGLGQNTASTLSNLDLQLGAALSQNAQGLGNQVGGIFGNLGTNIGQSLQTGAAGASQGLIGAGQAQSAQLAGFNNAFQGGLANFLSYQNQQNNQALLARQNALLANSPLFGGGGQ